MQNKENFQEKLMSVVDEETLEWAQKASTDLAKRMSYYKCAMLEVETRFNVLNEEYILEHSRTPINSIKCRLKSLPSLREKMDRKGIPVSLDSMENELDDIAGVRVICSFPADVYAMADAFLKQEDVVLLERKDYVAQPKENGYRSLHLIVAVPVHLSGGKRMTKVEVQLRTIAMDFWASLEHQLRYKQDVVFTAEMSEELYQCALESAALDERMDRLRKSVEECRNELT